MRTTATIAPMTRPRLPPFLAAGGGAKAEGMRMDADAGGGEKGA